MSESGKRKLFGRMFGGGKTPGPAPLEEDKSASEAPAPGEAAQAEQPRAAPAGENEPEAPRPRWFQRLRQGLTRTSSKLTEGIAGVFTKRKLDDETLEELEDLLIQADLGLDVAGSVAAALKKSRYNSDITSEEVRAILAQEVEKVLAPVARPLEIDSAKKPYVVLVVGVNGTGKTTTIGKYASQFTKQGLKVMLAAGDTFRAAAIEQLKIWGERTGAAVVASDPGADAAGLAFDALQRAKDDGFDLLLIDTAGRLQNKSALMAELEKVIRVIKKLDPTAPHSVLLTLDATTGQNALSQVEIFGKTAGVTGLVMTKLDGTARGGILVAISSKYALPVHAIGVGESAADLHSFHAQDFARAIAGVA
jgi:fused signal recognition particle receptor